ncbi:glycosyltransferase family 9 protein [Castellaniella caeni]|uniref:glycosyltransferase family 9 protein n=1 Tax=Castellaniella caeni TaxID=266123 RepID=UPI000A036575|nr:glycosyltransferase family 9 protein [Castellaniella caeni]
MSLPSLQALLDTGLPVVACARPWAQDLLAAYPLAGFIPMQGTWRADRAAVRRHLKQAGYNRPRGLLLPDSLSSALVFRFAGIACAGYRDDGRSLLLRWPCRKPKGPLHAVQSWYHLTRFALGQWHLAHTGPAEPADELSWTATQAHEQQAIQALAQAGLRQGAFVLIAPTAVGLHKGRIKAWSGFDGLTQSLQARGLAVVMAPPSAEREAAQAAAPSAQLLPPLGLGAFAALTRHAALVVCNDSGVSHLAAAAGARQLTLFGVTHPTQTGPWSNRATRLGRMNAWPTATEVFSTAIELLNPSPAA